eukprot:scaffold6676_cov23-Tisochrysis_lutea.AAC.2
MPRCRRLARGARRRAQPTRPIFFLPRLSRLPLLSLRPCPSPSCPHPLYYQCPGPPRNARRSARGCRRPAEHVIAARVAAPPHAVGGSSLAAARAAPAAPPKEPAK